MQQEQKNKNQQKKRSCCKEGGDGPRKKKSKSPKPQISETFSGAPKWKDVPGKPEKRQTLQSNRRTSAGLRSKYCGYDSDGVAPPPSIDLKPKASRPVVEDQEKGASDCKPRKDAPDCKPRKDAHTEDDSKILPPLLPKLSFPPSERTVDLTVARDETWDYDVGPFAENDRSEGKYQQRENIRCAPQDAERQGKRKSRNVWRVEDFKITAIVGRGKFGSVYRATEVGKKERTVALKILKKKNILDSINAPNLLRREVEIQTRLCHPNIIGLFGYFHSDRSVYLVLENSPHGDLFKHCGSLRLPGRRMPHHDASRYILQVVRAVSYLQSRNISHRDIKPENILVSGDERNVVKICDFGWAVHSSPPLENWRSTLCGTPEYVPPEMLDDNPRKDVNRRRPFKDTALEKKQYDARFVDSWAVGVLAHELVYGQSPFFMSERKIAQKKLELGYELDHEVIFDSVRRFEPEMIVAREKNETKFVDFVRKLMTNMPNERMAMSEAQIHPWLCDERSPL